MNTAWPTVVDRLLVLLPTLPGWSTVTVSDGPYVGSDYPMQFCTVGYVEGEDFGGTFDPILTGGNLQQEDGTVVAELACQSGNVTTSSVRSQAFTLVAAVTDALEADETLGVAGVGAITLSASVAGLQNDAGSEVRVVLTFSYTAYGV